MADPVQVEDDVGEKTGVLRFFRAIEQWRALARSCRSVADRADLFDLIWLDLLS